MTPVLAPRTSPTNVGLALLADLAALDFGWLDAEGFLARVERALGTVEGLERWQGHILNWYDTRTLEPLEPRYVSTVDSGNLVACLLVLARGLQELAESGGRPARGGSRAPRARSRRRDGLRVALRPARGLFVDGLPPA